MARSDLQYEKKKKKKKNLKCDRHRKHVWQKLSAHNNFTSTIINYLFLFIYHQLFLLSPLLAKQSILILKFLNLYHSILTS